MARLSTRQDWFVAGVEPRKRGCALGMWTKPSHRLTRHWMGLSSRDNWLSIRERCNNRRVSRRAVNHYLSVRQTWLHIFIPFTPCLYFSLLHEMTHSFMFSPSLSCCSPGWYWLHLQSCLVSVCDLCGDPSPDSTHQDTWVRVSPSCHQQILSAQCLALLEGQVVSVYLCPGYTLWPMYAATSWDLSMLVAPRQHLSQWTLLSCWLLSALRSTNAIKSYSNRAVYVLPYNKSTLNSSEAIHQVHNQTVDASLKKIELLIVRCCFLQIM